MQTLRHGTQVFDDGRLAALVDRHGTTLARLRWDGDRLAAAEVAGAPGTWLVVDGDLVDDPLVGPAHPLRVAGEVVTTCGAIDWRRPRTIPAIAAPGRLPPLTGTALLNLIARLSYSAGVQTLRYAGSYPTSALWSALQTCFTTTSDEPDFTATALDRIARGARDELPVDFTPAPCERHWLAPNLAVERRADVERLLVDGLAYVEGGSPRRLVATADGWAAEVWFGDAPWARLAEVDRGGALRQPVTPPPAVTSRVLGAAFPPPLVAALAELIAELVPAPLADDARAFLAAPTLTITWADLGARVARADATGFAVHAMLWERLAPHGLARVALALAEALAPVVTTALIAALTAVTEARP